MQPNQNNETARRRASASDGARGWQQEQGGKRRGRKEQGGTVLGKPELDLEDWLRAEELGQEERSEHALLELLSHLPETNSDGMTSGGTEASTQDGFFDNLASEDFAARLVRRIEKESRKRLRWTPVQTVLIAAGSVLVCWLGVLMVAMFLGLEVAATATPGEVLAFCARSIARVPNTLAAAASNIGGLWVEARTATLWLYSPWLLLSGWVSLLVASAALVGLGRLLSNGKRLEVACVAPSPGVV